MSVISTMPEPKFHKIKSDSFYYQPVCISIGPYDHPKAPLNATDHRNKCLERIRSKQESKMAYNALAPLVNELKGMYVHLGPSSDEEEEDDNKFLEMMIADAWYLLLILTASNRNIPNDDVPSYDDDDIRLLESIEDIDKYKRDMLLYENQMPLEVVAVMAALQTPKWANELPRAEKDDATESVKWNTWRKWINQDIYKFLVKVVANFFELPDEHYPFQPENQPLHILHIYRNILLGPIKRSSIPETSYHNNYRLGSMKDDSNLESQHQNDEPWYRTKPFNIPSSKNLQDARIVIQTSGTPYLMDIKYEKMTLTLPLMCPLNGNTESAFQNVIVFERVNESLGNHFTSCIYFFSKLVKRPEDSPLLIDLGVFNTTWNDALVAKMFQNLCKKIDSHHSRRIVPELLEVEKKLGEQYTKNLQPWRKDLFEKYLKSPCAIISLIFAFILFSMSAVQTGYSVAGYYKKQ